MRKMKVSNKIKLELILRKIIVYTLILSGIFAYAFVLGKEKETLFLMISYTITRNMFDKQFHCTSTIKCIKTTLIVFVISITAILHYTMSTLECLLIGVVINYVGYIFVLIPIDEIKKKNKRKKILKVVSNNEESIDNYCKEHGISSVSETIYLYLNNTIEETA